MSLSPSEALSRISFTRLVVQLHHYFHLISPSESRSCCQRHAAAILRPKEKLRDKEANETCASVESHIYSQCNIYEAGAKKKTYEFYTEKAANKEEQRSGTIVSEGDMLLNGAQPCLVTQNKDESMFHPSEIQHGQWNQLITL
ncbi:hypothetical protein PIB30_026181 [Stylosanthes scabra]|uniref:Uncharacterized protein n=1 Tax=Stylosanthes scabra TaxID=79078 RepID=A0ABU6X8G6_9FABA|nr:hypothetical protein [Stylosanthes scabra]